jgi:hypothetical protein
VVEGARLESVYTSKGYRGFESLSLRKYSVSDLEITRLNYEFISDYAFWLKSIRNCNHNSTMKYLANFKKVVLICVKKGWLHKDPFQGFKLAKREVEHPFLTESELREISSKQFATERLNYVKDIFLFSCYTGLAYADVKKLMPSPLIPKSCRTVSCFSFSFRFTTPPQRTGRAMM